MRKPYLYLAITVGLLIVLVTGIFSCTRINGVNNDQVVETPFNLFFGDISGAVYSSNDGANINKEIFEADGYPCKAICVSYNNILLVKQNLYVSTDNGISFNHSYDSSGSYPGKACNGYLLDLNQSMIVNIQDWNKVFIVNDDLDQHNYTGLSYSLYAGGQGNWYLGELDTTGHIGDYGPYPYLSITTMTLMPNGVLAGYDSRHNRNFYRTKTTFFYECTANPDTVSGFYNYGAPYNHSGNHLPYNDSNSTPIQTGARYSLGHYNNQLIAIDQNNCHTYGAYYSDDTGRNWAPMTGLPNYPLLCVESPFEEVCLVGTAGAGLYILNTNTHTWQANNNGLASNLTVRSIVGKQRTYKNGKTVAYIFLATDAGIYQSLDGANTWTLTMPGNFTAIY